MNTETKTAVIRNCTEHMKKGHKMKPTSPAGLSKWVLKLLCSTRLILNTLKLDQGSISLSANLVMTTLLLSPPTLLYSLTFHRNVGRSLPMNPVSVSISTSATRTFFYLSIAGCFQVNGIVASKEPLNSRV